MPHVKGERMTDEERAELGARMRTLYEEKGLTIDVLARKFGIATSLTRKLLVEAGTTLRQAGSGRRPKTAPTNQEENG